MITSGGGFLKEIKAEIDLAVLRWLGSRRPAAHAARFRRLRDRAQNRRVFRESGGAR